MRVKRPKHYDLLCDKGSFQEAIGSILAFAQCFGIMPVVGVTSSTALNLRFQRGNVRTFYSFIVFILISMYAGFAFWIAITHEIEFDLFSE